MTKSRPPITVPTLIKVPNTPGVMTTLDNAGVHHIQCDLCYSDITLTVTAHPRSLFQHRGRAGCLQARRYQGLPDPEPGRLPPLRVPRAASTSGPSQLSGLGHLPCPGLSIVWEPGSIWQTYPYHQHEIRAVGWKPVRFVEDENEIVLRSDKCHQGILGTDEPPCNECRLIEYSANYRDVMERAQEAKDHTPWDLLTVEQMQALLHKMAVTIMTLRTKLQNAERHNQVLQTKLDNHTRIMMLLGTHDVPGLRRLIAAALRRGISAQSLVLRLQQAIDGVYRPRGGFNQRDEDIAFLVKAIAGPRLLYALQKSHGFASTSTVQRSAKVPRLLSSIGIPSADEMDANMTAFLDPAIKIPPQPSPSGKLPGNIVMFDGIAMESKCRYCDRRDSVTGLCREHSQNINPRVTSFPAIEKIRTALFDPAGENQKVCFGSDATVVAIAPYGRSDHYQPVPLIVSPTDKTEKGEWLALWIQTLIDRYGIHIYGKIKNGPIFSIGSDGDGAFRKAKHIICIKVEIDPDSDLGKIICPLLGMNTWTSKEGITGTCDPKHVFKRFGTLLRNAQGFMVDDTIVMPNDILAAISALPNLTQTDANSILYPSDRQNVPKAVSLIQHLLKIHDLPLSSDPGLQHSRRKLNFMSKMLGCFVLPFITVSMTLSMQLESLSTYSHLATAVCVVHGLACLTGALYADSQSIVKNIFITVARLQVIDRNLCFYLLMEGTDRLENLFCECRTQDHSRNFDIEQLTQKLAVATLIHAAFERNPDINRGHRKLNLQEAIGVDHVNPKSWVGDTCIGNVNLKKEWDSGREKAIKIMERFLGNNFAPNFNELFVRPDHDILRPNGDYVGVKSTPDDSRSEDEGPLTHNDAASIPQSLNSVPTMDMVDSSTQLVEPTNEDEEGITRTEEENVQNLATIVAFAADIEGDRSLPESVFENGDELDNNGIELDHYFSDRQDGQDENDEPEIFSRTLKEGTNEYLKTSLVATLRPENWKRIPVRPFRVQGKTMESIYSNSRSPGELETSIEKNELVSKDLVAFLVRSDTKFCLAILQTIGFRFKSEKTLKLSMGLDHITNGQGDYRVNGQIIEVSPTAGESGLWDWTKRYVHLDVSSRTARLTHKQFVIEVPASLIFPVAAVPAQMGAPSTDGNAQVDSTWRIKQADLDNILKSAWDSLNGEGEDILGNLPLIRTIINPNVIPYRDQSGKPAFVVENLPSHLQVHDKKSGSADASCELCGEVTTISKMRGHVGKHILYSMRRQPDVKIRKSMGASPCGFCGLDSGCQTQLTFKKNGVAFIKSTCPNHYEKMQYKAALEPSKGSPCTNVPIHCRLCAPLKVSGELRTIWKYNTIYHLLSEHSQDSNIPDNQVLPKIPGQMAVDMFVSSAEEAFMKIPTDATKSFREEYGLQNSDGIEEIKEEIKRERASTLSTDEPSGKRRRQ